MKADITIVCYQCDAKITRAVIDTADCDDEVGQRIKRLLFNHRPHCKYFRLYPDLAYDQLKARM